MKADERALLVKVASIPTDENDHRVEVPGDVAARLGIHPKRADYLFQKWTDKAWADYGVSARTCWLTDAGKEAALKAAEDWSEEVWRQAEKVAPEIKPIPEPEAKHLLTGNETLVVLEYPEELSGQTVGRIREELARCGVTRCLILVGGARLNILSPKPGDVVVLEVASFMDDDEMTNAAGFLRRTLEAAGLHNPVLVTDAECKTYTPDEEAMRRMGWVRADKEEKTLGLQLG